MNRYQALAIYAILIIATGVILISLAYFPSRVIQYAIAVTMVASAVFAFLTAYKSKGLQIPLKYHGLHAIGMTIYGFAVLFYASDIERFFRLTTFFLLYYGISECIFAMRIFSMRLQNINTNIVVSRLVIGFVIALGAVIVIATATINQNQALLFSGIVFIFSGINLILFKKVLKRLAEPM